MRIKERIDLKCIYNKKKTISSINKSYFGPKITEKLAIEIITPKENLFYLKLFSNTNKHLYSKLYRFLC